MTNKPNLLVWTSKNVIQNNIFSFELGLGPIEPIVVGTGFYTPLGPGPGPGPGVPYILIKSISQSLNES